MRWSKRIVHFEGSLSVKSLTNRFYSHSSFLVGDECKLRTTREVLEDRNWDGWMLSVIQKTAEWRKMKKAWYPGVRQPPKRIVHSARNVNRFKNSQNFYRYCDVLSKTFCIKSRKNIKMIEDLFWFKKFIENFKIL